MIGIMCKKYNVDYIVEHPEEIEENKINLLKVVNQIDTLCGPELEETIVTYLKNDGTPTIRLSNNTTYNDYYPSDYGLSLKELFDKILKELVDNNSWL